MNRDFGMIYYISIDKRVFAISRGFIIFAKHHIREVRENKPSRIFPNV